jgi:hypothetical protein
MTNTDKSQQLGCLVSFHADAALQYQRMYMRLHRGGEAVTKEEERSLQTLAMVCDGYAVATRRLIAAGVRNPVSDVNLAAWLVSACGASIETASSDAADILALGAWATIKRTRQNDDI